MQVDRKRSVWKCEYVSSPSANVTIDCYLLGLDFSFGALHREERENICGHWTPWVTGNLSDSAQALVQPSQRALVITYKSSPYTCAILFPHVPRWSMSQLSSSQIAAHASRFFLPPWRTITCIYACCVRLFYFPVQNLVAASQQRSLNGYNKTILFILKKKIKLAKMNIGL